MDLFLLSLIGFFSFLCVSAGIWPLICVLRRKAILDHPNHRSNHMAPTPKGAGIVLIPVIVLGWGIVAYGDATGSQFAEIVTIGIFALILGVVSWIDDLREVPPPWRLVVHTLVVSFALFLLPRERMILDDFVHPHVGTAILILMWVWFINLFNFMDGVDGISGAQSLAVSLGIILILLIVGIPSLLGPLSAVVVGGVAGFMVWNWHPAKIFLGDVGSAPLGFLLGWMVLHLAVLGEWEAAIILPAYYVSDASVTLVRRLLRGERVWQPHREHFYQTAILNGRSHAFVALSVFIAGIILVFCAAISATVHGVTGILMAVVVVITTMVLFRAKTDAKG